MRENAALLTTISDSGRFHDRNVVFCAGLCKLMFSLTKDINRILSGIM
jgi:hypothetical protein